MKIYRRELTKCLNKIQEVSKTGRTIIFVSHNIRMINRLCTRGILLENGEIIEEGPMNICVEKYIGFDPNIRLRPGYVDIAKACGVELINLTKDTLEFNNGSVIHSLPFEKGASLIPSNSIHFVFTSPPFFDYEIYNEETNPSYENWINNFYIPFFQESCRICMPNGYLAIYVDDTSSGIINDFITNNIEKICPVTIRKKIGFVGIMSKKNRDIWVFQKHSNN